MSLDLSAAVEAAARDYYERQRREPRWAWDGAPIGPTWERLDPAFRAQWREGVLDTVSAAAPLIEAAVREQITEAIEAKRDRLVPGTFLSKVVLPTVRVTLTEAALIARGADA